MRLAIVVGHNSDRQGAIRVDTKESEFQYNSRLAEIILSYVHLYPDMEARIFFRQPGGGYTHEIRRVYAETDAWRADATVELHFNGAESAAATGAETLTSGTPSSVRMAIEVNNAIVGALGLRDRGVKTRREGRGSASLMTGNAPAILIEPFFGSSPQDCARVGGAEGQEAIARAVLRGVAKAYDMMPRKDLSESRTIKAVSKARKAGGIGKTAAATTALTTALDNTSELNAAIAVGKTLDDALPWLSGAGVAIVIGALIYKQWQENTIEAARVDDHRRELR